MELRKNIYALIIIIGGLLISGLFLPYQWTTIATLANYISAFALTWNLLYGFSGIFNLGHTVLIGIGGYTVGMLGSFYSMSPWLLTFLGGTASLVLSTAVMCLPALRIGNRQFTLLSLMVSVLSVRVVLVLSKYTGGLEGIVGFTPITVDPRSNFFLSAGALVLVTLSLLAIKNSSFGWKLEAIRDNSLAAENCGINVPDTKTIVFMISAFLSGICGAQYAYYSLVVSAQNLLELTLLTDFAVSAIVGGTSTVFGPILGGYIYVFLKESFRDLGTFRLLFFYVGTILLIIKWPDGIAGLVTAFSRRRSPK